MPSAAVAAAETAPALLWTGRILTGLVIAFLLLDAGMKLAAVQPVIEASRGLGYPDSSAFARGLGTLLLACTILYCVPRTTLLGAVLLTGYLGGAIASHLRLSHPWLSHTLFGLYVGVMLWAALLIRRPDLRALIFQ